MGLFFTISGYLLYLGINEKSDIIKKLKKRIWSLVIPFLLWNTLMLCYEIAYGLLKNNLSLSLKDIFLGYTFDTFVGPFWYVLALVLLLPLCPLLYKLKQKPLLFIIIIIVVSIFALLLSECNLGDNLILNWMVRLLNHLPYYLFGAFLGLCKSDDVAKENYNVNVISIISTVVTLTFVLLFVFDLKLPYTNWIINHITPIAVWLMIPCKLFSSIKISYYMRTTFFVFAMHMLLIGITNTLLQKMVGDMSLPLFVTLPLHFVSITIIFAICNLFSYIAGKILPKKIYSMLSGGRI